MVAQRSIRHTRSRLMHATIVSRRTLACGLAVLAGLLAAHGSAAPAGAASAAPAPSEGLSHTAEAIHQEVSFSASCQRLYAALTDARAFDAVTRLSDGVTLLSAPGAQATAIGSGPGSAFTLFGGYITGRNLDMVPDQHLVQAWRAGGWPAGDYSVVRFSLAAAGSGCRLVLDHRGFPQGQGKSLAYGWRVHYWQPLAKFLAN
jgi:activator of HSP90 ATPase